jgi:hypothetical protein
MLVITGKLFVILIAFGCFIVNEKANIYIKSNCIVLFLASSSMIFITSFLQISVCDIAQNLTCEPRLFRVYWTACVAEWGVYILPVSVPGP